MASGVLEYLDAMSVPPYRNYAKSPETAIEDYNKLRTLIDRYAPAGKKGMPIISSEWGYSSATKGVSQEVQAASGVRMQLSNLLYGIPVSIWYDWKNDGDDPADHESNFGTVTSNLEPKPVYAAIQLMNKQLKGFTLVRRIELKNGNDFVLLFKNKENKYKISAWTADSAHSVLLDNNMPKIKRVAAIDGNGNVLKLRAERGRLSLDLKALPQYISIGLFPDKFGK